MHGNVYELCLDWYGGYGSDAQVDPQGPASGLLHVVRGGCYFSQDWQTRSAARGQLYRSFHYSGVGFRLLRMVR